jgi:hypothetical protein
MSLRFPLRSVSLCGVHGRLIPVGYSDLLLRAGCALSTPVMVCRRRVDVVPEASTTWATPADQAVFRQLLVGSAARWSRASRGVLGFQYGEIGGW